MEGNRSSINFYLLESSNTCLTLVQNDANLWHRRMRHVIHNTLRDTIVTKAIRGIPYIKGELERICGSCQLGRQVQTPHLESQLGSTTRLLELVHMDIMGLMRIERIARKGYEYVCVDDFSRLTWVNFLRTKSKAFEAFEAFEELWQRLYEDHINKLLKISRTRSDHDKEFKTSLFENLCMKNGIEHEFSTPKTPQQNGIVERKNINLQERARVMLKSRSFPAKFWV